MVRAKYKGPARGLAEDAHQAIKQLVGSNDTNGEYLEGQLYSRKQSILYNERSATEATDADEQLYWIFKAQEAR